MSKRINDIPIKDLRHSNLTDNYKEMTVDEWEQAFIKLENAYNPLHKEVETLKNSNQQLSKQKWKHLRIWGLDKLGFLIVTLTFFYTMFKG